MRRFAGALPSGGCARRCIGSRQNGGDCYALGWTQHSKGVQIIRTASILQLLLGNIGRPGGGILALRGHASIQGSTDIPTLYDILPGYLSMPRGDGSEETLHEYLTHQTKADWSLEQFSQPTSSACMKATTGRTQRPKMISATIGTEADRESFVLRISLRHGRWKMEGMFMMGQNPAVAAAIPGSADIALEIKMAGRPTWSRSSPLTFGVIRPKLSAEN